MSIKDSFSLIDWKDKSNAKIAKAFIDDAFEYMKRVEAHIFQGNEIRADMWMDFAEKQDEISRLDRKRTEAHNKLLGSARNFIDLLEEKSDFCRSDYKLNNRTQIADFVALIAFELTNIEPVSRVEGQVRDELAEMIHNGKITAEMINEAIGKYLIIG